MQYATLQDESLLLTVWAMDDEDFSAGGAVEAFFAPKGLGN